MVRPYKYHDEVFDPAVWFMDVRDEVIINGPDLWIYWGDIPNYLGSATTPAIVEIINEEIRTTEHTD